MGCKIMIMIVSNLMQMVKLEFTFMVMCLTFTNFVSLPLFSRGNFRVHALIFRQHEGETWKQSNMSIDLKHLAFILFSSLCFNLL